MATADCTTRVTSRADLAYAVRFAAGDAAAWSKGAFPVPDARTLTASRDRRP